MRRESESEREREGERASSGTFHNRESRASPVQGLRITMLAGPLDSLASVWPRLSPDSDERLAGWYQ
jgi:hypothetical protein